MGNAEFEPLIIAFCCNWCSYAGADLAGVSRQQYPPNVRVIRVMCSGMVHPNLVINALTKGADGVIMCGCHPGDCHYLEGNLKAEKRAEGIFLMLEDFGLENERFRLGGDEVRQRHAGVHRGNQETGPQPVQGVGARMDISRKFEGKKFMWDGAEYKEETEARSALGTYLSNGFDAKQIEEGGAFYVFTRKVVTEVKVEGNA